MEWLAEDLRAEPWLTFRKHKYMAHPRRHGWGNRTDILNKYRRDFLANMLFGAVCLWPMAALAGRRAQTYQGGCAVVPY